MMAPKLTDNKRECKERHRASSSSGWHTELDPANLPLTQLSAVVHCLGFCLWSGGRSLLTHFYFAFFFFLHLLCCWKSCDFTLETSAKAWQQTPFSAFMKKKKKTFWMISKWSRAQKPSFKKKCYTTLKLFFMVLRRRLPVACAFMLSRIGVTSWPLFLDWLLIYRTLKLPPAHSTAHKGRLSEMGCSV